MVVVAIVGVLAIIAVASYKGYMRKARIQEGIAFLMDLKLKQETYFSAYSQFVDTGIDPNDFYPSGSAFKPEELPVGWGTWDCTSPANMAIRGFCALGYSSPPSSETFFQYVTIGWAPGDGTPPSDYISDPSRRWWFARAQTYYDPNGDRVIELRFSSELTQVVELWP
jgi:type II secretory pathway pseudopilin PulG